MINTLLGRKLVGLLSFSSRCGRLMINFSFRRIKRDEVRRYPVANIRCSVFKMSDLVRQLFYGSIWYDCAKMGSV